MSNMDQVERLRAYADISVEEARDVLAEAGDDLLEAVILLERQGKIKPPTGGEQKTGAPPPGREPPYGRERSGRERYQNEPPRGESFSQTVNRFLRFVGRVIHKGNINKLVVQRRGEHILSMPVTLLVVLTLFCFWWVFPLLIIGLFFDFRYWFQGPDMGDDVNNVMNSAADTAQTIKKDIKESTRHERDDSDR